MSYVRTKSSMIGMGTAGAAASAGARAGSGTSSGMSTATSTIGAASSIVGSIVDAYYDITGMRSERQNLAIDSNISTAQLLEEGRYSTQAQQMAAEELVAQNDVDSATSAALRSQEDAIALETARLRRTQAQQEIEASIGGSLGRSRPLPSWAWWGIGIGGIGATFLVIWLVSRKQ